MEIRLLVDGEVEHAFGHQLDRGRQQVVPAAALEPGRPGVVGLDDLPDALRAAGVDGEHPRHARVAEVVRLDRAELLLERGSCGDVFDVDRRTGLLDGGDRAVDAGLDVELAGRGDEQRDVTLTDELDDPLAHLEARSVEVLTDVGEAGVGRVGVVGDDRDPGRQGALDRIVERLEVDDRNRDPVGVGGDRGLEGVDHLGVVGPLRSGPLERRAEQSRRVLDAVLGRDEERVRRHVVDEDEVPLRSLGEVATHSAPAAAVVVGRVVVVTPQLTRSPAAAVSPIALKTSRRERSGRCISIMSPFDPGPRWTSNHVMIGSSLNIT